MVINGRGRMWCKQSINMIPANRNRTIMFWNLVFRQHLQLIRQLQSFEMPTTSLYTFCHPLKPAVYDTRPRRRGMSKMTPSIMLGHLQRPRTAFPSAAIFSALELLFLQLRSSAPSNCFSFSCVVTEVSKNQSQEAKSGGL